jgi:hypothetical protein
MTRHARPRYSKLRDEVRDHVDDCRAGGWTRQKRGLLPGGRAGRLAVRLGRGAANVQSREIHAVDLAKVIEVSHCRRLTLSRIGPKQDHGYGGHRGRGEEAQAGESQDAIACGDVTSRCGGSVAARRAATCVGRGKNYPGRRYEGAAFQCAHPCRRTAYGKPYPWCHLKTQ